MKAGRELHFQDGFLFESLKEERPVGLVLRSGRTISGRIKRFDRYVLLIENGADLGCWPALLDPVKDLLLLISQCIEGGRCCSKVLGS